MIKKLLHPPRSLDGKMLYMILLSLLCAALVYLGVYSLGSLALERIYMSPESRAARQAEIYSEFYQFVTSNQITGDNTDAVAGWVREHPYVTILVYQDETLNLRPAQGGPSPLPSSSALQYSSVYGNRLLAVLLGSVAFISIMFWYIRRLTNRIIRLSREADIIGAGDLEAPITVKGEDELATLASEMDSMRRSVIERMSGERRAWEANSELITAISHDIRTPMTALIGYLGLLNEGRLEAREKQFAASAYDKAMELKDLTDELFKYFLVFGRAELELNRESFDARFLLEQLLGEAEFDLRDAGFEVQRSEFAGECQLSTDPLYLKRVVDNLVSNAKKYADRADAVRIESELLSGTLKIRMINTAAKGGPRVESTKIGLRTCEKIMSSLGGRFQTELKDGVFTAEFCLPTEVERGPVI